MKLNRFFFLILSVFCLVAVPAAVQAGITSGFSPSEPLNGDVGTGAVIKIDRVFVGRNATDPKLNITVTNNNPTFAIGGISFDIDLTNVPAEVFDGDPDNVVVEAAPGFILKGSYPQGTNTLRIVLLSDPQGNPAGAIGPGGSIVIGKLWYTAPDALGTDTPVVILEPSIVVSSFTLPAFAFDVTHEDGAIQTGIRGDINRNGVVNILDGVELVLELINDSIPSTLPDLKTALGKIYDVTANGGINVADVIGIINIILGIDIHDGAITKPIAGNSIIDLRAPILVEGALMVPVMLDTRHPIAGAQATFTFDPLKLRVGTPQLHGETYGLTLESRVTDDGTVRVIVYSLRADTGLAADDQPMLLIPVTPLLDHEEAELALTDMTLADRQTRLVPVDLGTTTQAITKEMLAPKTFALNLNYPNPFNPTTTIAYDVAEQAHITLVVYNLLGQEVIRLVDEVQQGGRYQVTWNARNTQNREVASGIYLYRLVSSTGFSEAKRMTLLK